MLDAARAQKNLKFESIVPKKVLFYYMYIQLIESHSSALFYLVWALHTRITINPESD